MSDLEKLKGIIQPFFDTLESYFKQIFQRRHLEICASAIGFDVALLKDLDVQDVRIHGYLGAITFIAIFCHAFGLSCFIDLMLSGFILNQGILWLLCFVFFNIYRIAYAVGGKTVEQDSSETEEWYPKMGVGIFIIFISFLSSLSFSVYEALYVFGWEQGALKVDRLFEFEIMQHPVFIVLGFLFLFLFSVLPIFYRYYHLDTFRRYYNRCHHIQRQLIKREWKNYRANSEEALRPYRTYRKIKLEMYVDPPFNTRPLIMGLLDPENKIVRRDIETDTP